MRKNLPLLVLVGIVVLLGGYLVYNTFTQEAKPLVTRETKTPMAAGQNTPAAPTPEKPAPGQTQPPAANNQAKKSVVPETNPNQGEFFVYGEVKAVDMEKKIITIDQHMDDNSVKISPNVPVQKEAVIQNKQEDIGLAQLKPGDAVGIILTREGQARYIIVD